MNISITENGDSFSYSLEYHTYEIRLTDDLDREVVLSFMDGEPEDRFMMRDFKDVYKIEEALNFAYNAGRRGEGLSTTRELVE